MAVPFHTHIFELPVAEPADMSAGVATDKVVVPAVLGSAAIADVSQFATAAQGLKADHAASQEDLAVLAAQIECRASAYNVQNLIINGGFIIDQRVAGGGNELGVWGYDRWLNVAQGRQQYVEQVESGNYALYWDGGGTATLGSNGSSSSGQSPQQLSVQTGNLRVVVPFQAQNVCLIKLHGSELPSFNPYAPRPFAQELALCQRYYQKSSPLSDPPNGALTAGVVLPTTYGYTSAGTIKAHLYFPTRMVRPPQLGFYLLSGTAGVRTLDAQGENLSITIPSTPYVSEVLCTIANAIPGNHDIRFYQFNYAADAEMTQ